jgi:hypothetical protein
MSSRVKISASGFLIANSLRETYSPLTWDATRLESRSYDREEKKRLTVLCPLQERKTGSKKSGWPGRQKGGKLIHPAVYMSTFEPTRRQEEPFEHEALATTDTRRHHHQASARKDSTCWNMRAAPPLFKSR